jgi:sigma-B regulation protein RsbU (phosphoserine phosphatase)
MRSIFSKSFRRWAIRRFMPASKLGRLTLYVLAIRLAIGAMQLGERSGTPSTTLDGWGATFTFVFVVFFTIVTFRWIRQKLLWRLRNRLIVTYVFIGVIPVALILLMATIASYLFANQYATSQVNSEISAELRVLTQMALSYEPRPVARRSRRFPGLEFRQYRTDQTPDDLKWVKESTSGVYVDGGKLYLRAAEFNSEKTELTVASVPLTPELMERLVGQIGRVRLYLGQEESKPAGGGVVVSRGDGSRSTRNFNHLQDPYLTAGAVPAHSDHFWDPELVYGSIYPAWDWGTNKEDFMLMQVSTRAWALLNRLFSNLGSAASTPLIALAGIALFFGVVELFALFIGVGLTRTVTKSVYDLYTATQHINRGDLKHRIRVKNRDQLAALESSFNSMSESLERLVAEQKEKQRMESELAIAQEVQATLFPRDFADIPSLEVHGLCRPARTVSGDYYDFLQFGDDALGIAVGDISGKGISAALLMATIHSAVRAYEFGRVPQRPELVHAGAAAYAAASHFEGRESMSSIGGVSQSPAHALELLNRHLYNSTPAEKYATLFLGIYDGARRSLTFANAGHLPPLVIGEDGALKRLMPGGTVIGLFDNMSWEEETVALRHGDVFVAYSDGITEPENEFGEFGEDRLVQLIREHRGKPLARISEVVTQAVQDWIGSAEQPDDITLVLARAR